MALLCLTLFVHSAPRSENAPPCEDERVLCAPDESRALIAVLDGCGGTGAKKYPQAENWTGARIASTLASRLLFRWFSDFTPKQYSALSSEALAEDLQKRLESVLVSARDSLEQASASRFINSRMSKALPTTLAAVSAEKLRSGTLRLRSFWAGNSRCYAFPPAGLRQLTRDDLVGNYDPYEDLNKDGILSNAVNASSPFLVHSAETLLSSPCLIFSASDGVFSYFDSPIRLEWLLLDTLSRAKNPASWESELREELGGLSADDHTLQLAAIGFSDFSELKASYRSRTEELERDYIAPLDLASESGDAQRLRSLWDHYRKDYLALAPGEDAAHG